MMIQFSLESKDSFMAHISRLCLDYNHLSVFPGLICNILLCHVLNFATV